MRSAGMLAAASVLLLLILAGCRNPTVVAYEPYESPGALEPNDPIYSDQWHYRQINMPGAWGIVADPQLLGSFSPVLVAVVDNGILQEGDIDDNLFFNASTHDGGYEFDVLSGGSDYGDTDPTDDENDSHGTHVSGTIAAETNNGTGVSGVGWDRLQVMAVRALRGEDNGTTEDVMRAVYYSAQSNQSGVEPPTRDSRVVNLSLGGAGIDPGLYEAIEYAVSEGITVIAAAGNTGAQVVYPAAFDNTIAVSAVTVREDLASYSARGPEVDFSAPGGDEQAYVWSIVSSGDGDYAGYAGTSMATPHVSGVVGLLYSYAPNLNQDAVYAILANTAKDLGEPGHDEQFGHGLIDAQAALEYLINAGRDYPVQPRTLGGGAGGDAGGGGISSAAVSSLAADGAARNRGRRPAQRRGAILPEAGADLDETSIIIKLTESAETRRGVGAARSLAEGIGAAGAAAIGGRLYRIDLRGGGNVEAAIRGLGTHEDVEYAQPNYRYRLIQ
ncbi:MAG: S8 family serine peptidase [Spirochaetia bacterium]